MTPAVFEEGTMEKLLHLNCSINHLSSVPDQMSRLKQLQSLNLSDNRFEVIPSEIMELPRLLSLDFSKNLLQEVPKGIGNLRHLRTIHLRKNPILVLPRDFSLLSNLEEISLDWAVYLNNFLQDHRPEESADLISVRHKKNNLTIDVFKNLIYDHFGSG